MVRSKDNNTEARILEAAKSIFLRDGLQGARMQDIADLAQINRAMLHYYFRDKEMLSQEAMKSVISKFIGTFKANLNSEELPFKQKMDFYIKAEIDLAYNNPDMLIFALHEAARDPLFFRKIIPYNKLSAVFRKQLKEAYDNGEVKTDNIEEFITMVSSLCMFPFIAGPLYMMIFNIDEKQWEVYRRALKQKLSQLIKQMIFKE
ncbi:MAG: TetR/AcrR family transcriptional regulator [Bacteroides sp.]|jgi:AcrR family transcriptional regulator|nr:TetR/AcrR family transcriptional regulator [Bacteroides sp.]MCI1682735.1 TetR/AcrR family transcriptional regulator [Bacteroides sp.]